MLETELKTPEATIIKQGQSFDEKESAMYFIGRGDCEVIVIDQDGRPEKINNQLDEGDHFGEVQLIYKTHRTASVISKNYNTLAMLKYPHF